jgi:hypothetical protein
MRALPNFGSLRILSDEAKEAVRFVCDSSREIDSTTQREKVPKAVKLEWCSISAHERLDESLRSGRIVNVNESIPEIADPKVAAFHESKSPWGIEVSTS